MARALSQWLIGLCAVLAACSEHGPTREIRMWLTLSNYCLWSSGLVLDGDGGPVETDATIEALHQIRSINLLVADVEKVNQGIFEPAVGAVCHAIDPPGDNVLDALTFAVVGLISETPPLPDGREYLAIGGGFSDQDCATDSMRVCGASTHFGLERSTDKDVFMYLMCDSPRDPCSDGSECSRGRNCVNQTCMDVAPLLLTESAVFSYDFCSAGLASARD